jgi:hypothetical protein
VSELEDAMQQYMAYLVLSECRPFSPKDFLRFECDGKEYRPSYGTIRNKFCVFAQKGIIELHYKSNISFYTLKGHKFGKNLMTSYHTGDISISQNHSLYKMLQNHIFDKDSIHNIRLRLEVPKIYDRFSTATPSYPKDAISNDIRLPYWNINNSQMQIRIHKTDTITVIIGCSLDPIPLDWGLYRFYKIIGIAQGFLNGLLLRLNHNDDQIPDCDNWIITMWHFNRDGLTEYKGEKFSISVEKADHIIHSIYSKNFKGKTRVRGETQEYPNKTVKEAIYDKLRVPNVPDTSNYI